MVTVHAGGANSTIVRYLDNETFQGSFLPKNTNGSSSCFMSQPTVSTTDGLHKCYRSKHVHARFKGFPLSFDTLTNKCLCQSLDRVSSDDEYHSSTKIAISLFRRYRNVLDRGGTHNLEEFIKAGVNAYALGCTNEGLRKELINMMETGVEIEAMDNFGGLTSLKSKISSQEVDECILWLSIIFVTILCTPQPTVIRWSASPPVTQGVLYYWKGFCAIIANAYYLKGMAWLPVKTLQLEQMAVTGYAEEPSVVASRMRLVFSTLEVVSPQWPRA